MSVTLMLDGEGIEIEREVSEAEAARIMSVLFDSENYASSKSGREVAEENSKNSEDDSETLNEYDTLPDSFFSRLTQRQKAYVEILLEAEDWMLNEEIRHQLEEEYSLNCGGPQAISGIRSGFTRKYGEEFSIDERDWMGEQNRYRLNENYRDEIEAHWD